MAPKARKSFTPCPEQKELLPEISGNAINGLGEREKRRPTPIYWQKPDTIPHGPVQAWMTERFNNVPVFRDVYAKPGARGPRKLDRVADKRLQNSPDVWSRLVKSYVLENEGDLVGITALRREWIFEGFDAEKELPWLVVIGIAMDYEQFAAAPSSDADTRSALEVSDKYNQGARAAAGLSPRPRSRLDWANWETMVT
jgi:hypothetical protein